jgi:hypothetical protein
VHRWRQEKRHGLLPLPFNSHEQGHWERQQATALVAASWLRDYGRSWEPEADTHNNPSLESLCPRNPVRSQGTHRVTWKEILKINKGFGKASNDLNLYHLDSTFKTHTQIHTHTQSKLGLLSIYFALNIEFAYYFTLLF